MRLRNRFYTYPVIDTGNEFYVDSSFETDADCTLDGYNIKMSLSADLKNEGLERLVREGKAEYIHHIECPQTCYRSVIKTDSCRAEVLLKDSEINGTLQICGFLVAKENLENYDNDLFAPEFKGFKFDIDKGCALAIGSQINVEVDKIRDDLANTSSIFTIAKNLDPMALDMKVILLDSKIVIKLSEETYSLYENMSSAMDVQPVMHSMLIIPALQYVIYELKESKSELYNYENRRWFRGLRKICEKMNVSLDAEGLSVIDPLELAQKLINIPINNAFRYLLTWGDSYED